MTDRAAIQHLMSAAADGDRASVEPLFAALWPIVVGYAAKFLGDASLAEDCAQDALVKLFGQLDRFERDRDALTWALTHATWQCRTARRRRERRGETVLEAAPEEARDERDAAIDRELVHAALDTLETLPARDREILYATLTDDDELRRALAPATFRKRLERALGRLRLSWRSRHGTL
ncbi:MAG: sigma-70 family RNA polymerase sigma factor [Kofleriaceae bacterium]|nr:sigma-70 family RNA polymerase sigma factor [Kofleriaceae bacterium]